MESTHEKHTVIEKKFTVACDQCGNLIDWERVQLLPGKILCKKCLVYRYFSELYDRMMFSGKFDENKKL